MLLAVFVSVLLLGFGEAKNQTIYLDTDERPMCPCGGSSNRIRRPRVVGGLDAGNGTFPYACYIYFKVGDSVMTCGATLISDRHVLTATHCFDKLTRLSQVKVLIGYYDHRIATKYLGRARFIRPYPDYNPTTFHHDIALVELYQKKRGPVKWSHGIRAAVLPAPGLSLEPGTAVSVYGWGIQDNDRRHPNVLQFVEMPVADTGRCQQFYRDYIKDTMLCAGGVKGQGSCKGDSGGGLVVRLGNDYVLCGVVSFGPPGCPPEEWNRAPGVYTRVSNYTAWIYNNTMSSGCRPCISTASPTSASAFRRGRFHAQRGH